MTRVYQGTMDHVRHMAALKAIVAEERAKETPDQSVINQAVFNLIRQDVMPAMEEQLRAEAEKQQPDKAVVNALTQQLRDLHSNLAGFAKVLPADVVAQLLAVEPVAEPTE
jgi:hypothetical protein